MLIGCETSHKIVTPYDLKWCFIWSKCKSKCIIWEVSKLILINYQTNIKPSFVTHNIARWGWLWWLSVLFHLSHLSMTLCALCVAWQETLRGTLRHTPQLQLQLYYLWTARHSGIAGPDSVSDSDLFYILLFRVLWGKKIWIIEHFLIARSYVNSFTMDYTYSMHLQLLHYI